MPFPSGGGGLKGTTITQILLNLHFFQFQARDTTILSYFALFSFCMRQLLLFEMKDMCLAVFKESQNSKSHLYSRAVRSPFYIQYVGDDQKSLSQAEAERCLVS